MYCAQFAGNAGPKKWPKKSPSGHHHTTLSGYIFATKARIDNREKFVKQQYLLHMCSQYGERRPISGWDLLASLRHPCKFQRVSRLGGVTARHSSSGRQPNLAALNRGRHLYSAGRPSRWVLTDISSCVLSCSLLNKQIRIFYVVAGLLSICSISVTVWRRSWGFSHFVAVVANTVTLFN